MISHSKLQELRKLGVVGGGGRIYIRTTVLPRYRLKVDVQSEPSFDSLIFMHDL
jgi:hypothetical protein